MNIYYLSAREEEANKQPHYFVEVSKDRYLEVDSEPTVEQANKFVQEILDTENTTKKFHIGFAGSYLRQAGAYKIA